MNPPFSTPSNESSTALPAVEQQKVKSSSKGPVRPFGTFAPAAIPEKHYFEKTRPFVKEVEKEQKESDNINTKEEEKEKEKPKEKEDDEETIQEETVINDNDDDDSDNDNNNTDNDDDKKKDEDDGKNTTDNNSEKPPAKPTKPTPAAPPAAKKEPPPKNEDDERFFAFPSPTSTVTSVDLLNELACFTRNIKVTCKKLGKDRIQPQRTEQDAMIMDAFAEAACRNQLTCIQTRRTNIQELAKLAAAAATGTSEVDAKTDETAAAVFAKATEKYRHNLEKIIGESIGPFWAHIKFQLVKEALKVILAPPSPSSPPSTSTTTTTAQQNENAETSSNSNNDNNKPSSNNGLTPFVDDFIRTIFKGNEKQGRPQKTHMYQAIQRYILEARKHADVIINEHTDADWADAIQFSMQLLFVTSYSVLVCCQARLSPDEANGPVPEQYQHEGDVQVGVNSSFAGYVSRNDDRNTKISNLTSEQSKTMNSRVTGVSSVLRLKPSRDRYLDRYSLQYYSHGRLPITANVPKMQDRLLTLREALFRGEPSLQLAFFNKALCLPIIIFAIATKKTTDDQRRELLKLRNKFVPEELQEKDDYEDDDDDDDDDDDEYEDEVEEEKEQEKKQNNNNNKDGEKKQEEKEEEKEGTKNNDDDENKNDDDSNNNNNNKKVETEDEIREAKIEECRRRNKEKQKKAFNKDLIRVRKEFKGTKEIRRPTEKLPAFVNAIDEIRDHLKVKGEFCETLAEVVLHTLNFRTSLRYEFEGCRDIGQLMLNRRRDPSCVRTINMMLYESMYFGQMIDRVSNLDDKPPPQSASASGAAAATSSSSSIFSLSERQLDPLASVVLGTTSSLPVRRFGALWRNFSRGSKMPPLPLKEKRKVCPRDFVKSPFKRRQRRLDGRALVVASRRAASSPRPGNKNRVASTSAKRTTSSSAAAAAAKNNSNNTKQQPGVSPSRTTNVDNNNTSTTIKQESPAPTRPVIAAETKSLNNDNNNNNTNNNNNNNNVTNSSSATTPSTTPPNNKLTPSSSVFSPRTDLSPPKLFSPPVVSGSLSGGATQVKHNQLPTAQSSLSVGLAIHEQIMQDKQKQREKEAAAAAEASKAAKAAAKVATAAAEAAKAAEAIAKENYNKKKDENNNNNKVINNVDNNNDDDDMEAFSIDQHRNRRNHGVSAATTNNNNQKRQVQQSFSALSSHNASLDRNTRRALSNDVLSMEQFCDFTLGAIGESTILFGQEADEKLKTMRDSIKQETISGLLQLQPGGSLLQAELLRQQVLSKVPTSSTTTGKNNNNNNNNEENQQQQQHFEICQRTNDERKVHFDVIDLVRQTRQVANFVLHSGKVGPEHADAQLMKKKIMTYTIPK